MSYLYKEAVREDLNDFLTDRANIWRDAPFDDFIESAYEDACNEDSITGNASGSYTCNRELAKQYVLEDGLDYLQEMVKAGYTLYDRIGECFVKEDWETLDVLIRCFLVGELLFEIENDDDAREYWEKD